MQVSTKGAKYGDKFTNQLSENWIEAVRNSLPEGDEVKEVMKQVKKKGTPIRTVIVAVDKKEGVIKMVPVKVPNQRH